MDLTEMGWKGVEWFHLAQDRDQCWAVVNMVMESLGSGTTQLVS
jgi:hypothetical protein